MVPSSRKSAGPIGAYRLERVDRLLKNYTCASTWDVSTTDFGKEDFPQYALITTECQFCQWLHVLKFCVEANRKHPRPWQQLVMYEYSWHFISLRFLSSKRRDFRKKPSILPCSQFGGIEIFLCNLSGFFIFSSPVYRRLMIS